MASRLWRGVAAVALLAMAVPASASATTSVRVAVPDIAGSLYPQQAQGRAARFAVPSASLTPFYAPTLPADGTLPPCEWPAALCLAVLWTSQYQHDPFVLVAFESKSAVGSSTFDGVADTTTLLPVIEGDEGGDVTIAAEKRTLWQFHTLQTTSVGGANETIDVLFRLRQQSQLRGARDQLLVHVVASRADSATQRAAVETYVVYGNQRVRHSIVHGSANQIRLDVNISRDASRDDVLLQDSYPLVPVVRDSNSSVFGWRMMDNECRRCTALLLECESPSDLESGACTFETSMAEVPVCLRSTKGLSADWYRNALSGGYVGQTISLTRMIWECLKGIFARESDNYQVPGRESLSWNVTSALSCLAARQCPFGPLKGVLPNTTATTTMLQLTTPVPFTYHLEWPDTETLGGTFDVRFGGGPDFDPTFVATAEEISNASVTGDVERVLRGILSGLDYIRVHATTGKVDTMTTLDIEIWNLPHLYFDMNFMSNSQDSTYMIQPTNQDGATMLRVAALNKTQLAFESECDQCTSELSACREDDTCRLVVLPCVEREIAAIEVSTATVDPEYGTYVVNMLPVFASKCFTSLPVPSWNPIRRAFACLSRHTCRLDATNMTTADESTNFRLSNGSQVITAPLDVTQDGSKVVQLVLSYQNTAYQFHAPVENLAMFVRVFVLGNSADVYVDAQEYSPNPNLIQLRLTYANTLVSLNPSFSGSAQVNVLEDTAPKGVVEVADINTFSVEGIRTAISPFLNTATTADDLAAALNYSWILAPECLDCVSSLYGCSSVDVEQKTCIFDNADSQLAQCIRQALPRADLVSLLNTSAVQGSASQSKVVTTDITRCIQTATSLTGNTVSSRKMMTSALSCFTETRCPFGPVDLVGTDHMLQLVASSFVQYLRIPAETFRLDLIVSMGKFVIAQATITETDNAQDALDDVLAPFSITVQALSSYVDTEWTLTVNYSNVVTSDFNVQIATTSVPSPHYVEQALLRPTTRLLVGPRQVSRVYLESEITTEPTTNNSTPSPTEDPSSQLLQFSDECTQCDTIHLAACGRSQYCRSAVAPCFHSELVQYSFENLAQTMPDSSISVDLASILRSCVTSESFFDWWEPIQSWLGCYATARCPTTRPEQDRSEDGFLQFVPASVNISTTVENLWTAEPRELTFDFQPPGSSLSSRSFVVSSSETLRNLCELATQGISNVTVTTSPLTDSPGTSVQIDYEDAFFGALLLPTVDDQAVTSVNYTQAQILLRSTSSDFPPSPWNRLTDRLLDMLNSSPNQPQSCPACATTYLQMCSDMPTCKGYLLECLGYSIEIAYSGVSNWNSDRNVYQVLMGCARKLPVADWWPVQKYLVCMRDLQCQVNDGYPGATFIRLRSGHVRMPINSTTQPSYFPIYVSFGDMIRQLETVVELHSLLQSLIGDTGVVEMRTTAVGTASASQVDFVFRDYVGDLPHIEVGTIPVETWLPSIVLYSTDQVETPRLAADFTGYTVVPQCSGICSEHLEKCVRGDSYESLLCRYRILPCVSRIISVDIPSLGEVSTSIDFSNDFRNCFSTFYAPIRSIVQYLGCLAQTGCSLNEPRSTSAKTELSLRAGDQVLSVFGSKTMAISSPSGIGDSSPQTFSAENPDYFLWHVRTSVMQSLANVAVGVETLGDGSQGFTITYDNYLGFLPTVSGSDVSVLNDVSPSISILSSEAIATSQWDRLSGPLASFDVDKSSGCSSCALDNLMTCEVCMTMVVPSLLIMIQTAEASQSSRYNLTNIFYTCVDTLLPSEWVPVARMLNCLMAKGCPVSDDPGSVRPPNPQTTFLMVTSAKTTVWFPNTMPPNTNFAVGRAPNHSLDALPDTDYTTELYLDRDNQYAIFKQNYRSLLETTGQSPTVTVTERMLEPGSPQIALDIEIQDFFGWLPQSKDFPADSELPQILAQTYDNATGASLAGLVSWLEGAVTPTPTPKVPTEACADQCATAFYGCELDAITSAQCNYKTSSAFFASCLRENVPPSVFWGISRTLDTSYVITAALTKCFELAQEQDAVTGGASFRDDLWNLANDHLTCYELRGCAFGPLFESLGHNNMVVLQSTSGTRTFLVASETFTAVFRSTFGFRITDSTSFSEATSDEDLTLLVSEILPKGVVSVFKTDLSGTYSITVTYNSIFFPNFGLSLDAGDATVTDETGSVTTFAALRTVPLDTTYLADALNP